MHTRFVAVFLSLALAPFAWTFFAPAQIDIVPGSSVRGAELFRSKGCIECHAFGGAGGKAAPDLAQPNATTRGPMQLASALWNHAPRMWRAQEVRQIRPALDSMETADLFSYFFSLAYFNTPGNASKGRTLFEAGCADCHETTAAAPRDLRRRPLGPPVSNWAATGDP
jgi:mono/diheme cytochrome c family protein